MKPLFSKGIIMRSPAKLAVLETPNWPSHLTAPNYSQNLVTYQPPPLFHQILIPGRSRRFYIQSGKKFGTVTELWVSPPAPCSRNVGLSQHNQYYWNPTGSGRLTDLPIPWSGTSDRPSHSTCIRTTTATSDNAIVPTNDSSSEIFFGPQDVYLLTKRLPLKSQTFYTWHDPSQQQHYSITGPIYWFG